MTAGVMLGMFLGALEATVMGTAMPTVVARLGGIEHYSWVFTAYMFTSTATTPVWGRLSDLFGRRRIYLAGMLLFVVASALAGLATSMPMLIAFRALQGLGAGAVVPVGLTIIGEIYTLAERARMQALFSGTWGVGSVVGPLVGGWLTDNWSWRWIFYMNLPFGLAAAAIIGATYVERRAPRPVAIDWPGAVLLVAAITCLLGGVAGVAGPRWSWLAAAAILGFAFQRVERLATEPILPVDLLEHRGVTATTATALLVGMAIFGAIAFIPLFVRAAQGTSATEAGGALTPLMLGWVVSSWLAARLILRAGSRRTIRSGIAMMAAAFVALVAMGPGTPRVWLLADVTLLGAGTGLAMLTLLLSAQHAAPPGRLGLATSLQLFARSIGGAVGVALMGAVFTAGVAGRMGGAGKEAAALLESNGVLAGPLVAEALGPVFAVGAGIALAALVVSLRLPALAPPGRADEPATEPASA